jgi:hypothetical protein
VDKIEVDAMTDGAAARERPREGVTLHAVPLREAQQLQEPTTAAAAAEGGRARRYDEGKAAADVEAGGGRGGLRRAGEAAFAALRGDGRL